MGVATGTFVLPNGAPVANGAYQWKLSGDAIQFAIPTCDAPRLFGGNLDANGNMTATFAFNDALSTTAGLTTSYQLTIKDSGGGQVWCENYYLTGTAANLNLIPPGGSGPGPVTVTTNGLPTGQIGDIIRYNVNGDSAWDAVNLGRLVMVYCANAVPAVAGMSANGPVTGNSGGSNTNVTPTAPDQWGITVAAPSSASTSTVVGTYQGTGGNNGEYGWGAWYRWTCRWAAVTITGSFRYWIGLTTWVNGGSGTENSLPVGNTKFATNTPNSTSLAFRYSSGTDSFWQAAACITGGSQTFVSTGIPLDANKHYFEITYDLTTARFFIDHVLVASIVTNVPPSNYNNMVQFWTGDNQNTVNAISATFYYMTLALK
jgi:hypothetical protein